MDGRLLLATDGTVGAAGALHLTRALIERGMGPAVVLAVQEPLPLYDIASPEAMAQAELALEQVGVNQLRRAVGAQLVELGDDARAWEVLVEVGSPADVVAEVAQARQVALVLTGTGGHGAAKRLFGGETALRVMQLARAPVLAAYPDARSLPLGALVAEDFSEFSREAGIWALDLLEPGGDLHLAHVLRMPPTDAGLMSGDWLDSYLASVHTRLEGWRKELEATGKARVHGHVLQGEPAEELLRLAGKLGVGLIAAGRHGRGFLGRLLIGSVSTRLVRRARCSVLVVPPRLASGGGPAS